MMNSTDRATTRRRRDELVWQAGQAEDPTDVFAAASTSLRQIVPFDAAVWVTTDPGTGLPTGPTRVEDLEGVSAAQCSENWRREFVDGDVNLFRELGRADVPAGALRAAVGTRAAALVTGTSCSRSASTTNCGPCCESVSRHWARSGCFAGRDRRRSTGGRPSSSPGWPSRSAKHCAPTPRRRQNVMIASSANSPG